MAQLAYSRGLFARKHYGVARSRAIRAMLALGHGLRIIALVPQCGHREARARLKAERRAMAVQLGLSLPPYVGAGNVDGDADRPVRGDLEGTPTAGTLTEDPEGTPTAGDRAADARPSAGQRDDPR